MRAAKPNVIVTAMVDLTSTASNGHDALSLDRKSVV